MPRLKNSLLVLICLFFYVQPSSFAAPPAVVSSATLIGTDNLTLGKWAPPYGTVGYYIPNGPSSPPSDSSTFNAGGATVLTWGTNVTSTSALIWPPNGPSANYATRWSGNTGNSSPSLVFDVVVPAGHSQTVALYLLDYDKQGRAESVSVTDVSHTLLSGPTTVSGGSFANGEYLIWRVTGEVHINITLVSGPNAVASGIFFGENAATPPAVSANAYYTTFSKVVASNGLNTELARLVLPPGTYLITGAANISTSGSNTSLNLGCTLSHTTLSDPKNYIGTIPGIYGPTITNGSFQQAFAETSSTAVYTTATPDTVYWMCNNSNLQPGVNGSGTLTAVPYQVINIQ